MTNEKIKTEDLKVFHPSFFQCFPVFFIPFAMFLFYPIGVRLYYIYLLFWFLEMSFLLFVWVFLATTLYVIKPDRIEIKSGVFVKRSRTVPFDQIINITCKQNLTQKLFKIGDIFIDTPGGKPFELALAGVENHERVAELLFALKKGAI
ncbi:MAG TPA: PH domain-containing protein [bacterium]